MAGGVPMYCSGRYLSAVGAGCPIRIPPNHPKTITKNQFDHWHKVAGSGGFWCGIIHSTAHHRRRPPPPQTNEHDPSSNQRQPS